MYCEVCMIDHWVRHEWVHWRRCRLTQAIGGGGGGVNGVSGVLNHISFRNDILKTKETVADSGVNK